MPERILLIKLKHIGDSLLLTASTRAIRQEKPDAEISVLVRQGCEDILAGAESIDHIYTAVAPEAANRSLASHLAEFKTIHSLRRTHYDHIIELTRGDRGRWWSFALNAKVKASYEISSGHFFWSRVFDERVSAPDELEHAVIQDYQLVKKGLALKQQEPPALEFSHQRALMTYSVPADCAVLHPATRWKRKKWPESSWRQLIEKVLERGDQVLLSSGPAEEERVLCEKLRDHFSPDAVKFTGGSLSWAELAGVLYQSKVFIGVDTAAMHLAAACGLPTVGLFLPWIAPMWHPWGVRHQAVFAGGYPHNPKEARADLEYATAAMSAITPDQVLQARDAVLSEGNPIQQDLQEGSS